ncbi:MAG: PorV/PorQ family protein [Candidatus Marinimicrobia bacterium]|nr:PorV/PorQ family protein [Candidatus Neomarinimicrobiota bacterium]MCF7840434.1 PorV/PorQ family protein [Candidatus Neomarinimicrobiota bacterium]MCF7903028.1 PorV/PorQ family protein [Candidatus Neomarinimicrobiota bacterium]
MKLKAITLASLLFLTQLGYGQQIFEKVGTSGAHFLDVSMDAGIKAMGDAYTALVLDNAGAIHYNPATLVYIPSWSAHFGNVSWFAGIGLNSVAAAYNLGGPGAVGVYYRGLNSGDIDETTVTQQNGTGNVYTWQDMLMGVTFARSFTDRFSAGVNLGYLNQSVPEYDLNATAWSMDLGTFYMTGFRSLRLGMTIRNFGPEIDFEQTFIDFNNGEVVPTPEKYRPFPMPLTFQVGLAYDFLEDSDNQLLTVSVDAVHPNDSAERLNVGIDYRFLNTIHIRGGAYSNHNSASVMGGIGLDLQKIGVNGRFDYSVANYGLIGFVHQFSMIISG